MEMWARSSLGEHADFICACVDDDKNVAVNFERMFKFTSVINGVIMRRQDMPTYGQLGCSGFIVVGADGSCVSKKTKSFLDYNEKAFRDAENIMLTALEDAGIDLNAASSSARNLYSNGQKLSLEGITSNPSLNGTIVTVIEFDITKGRFHVMLNDGSNKKISVMPCCLAPIDDKASTPGIEKIHPPDLVGSELIDGEHSECTASINKCLSNSTYENLIVVLSCLENHFQHEESLAQVSGFGDSKDEFLPMHGHSKDHERILNLIRTKTNVFTQEHSDVNMSIIRNVASAFLDHARNFDTLFEGKL